MAKPHTRPTLQQLLQHLDASRPHLESGSAWDAARELIIQGLDAVTRADRARLLVEALNELEGEPEG